MAFQTARFAAALAPGVLALALTVGVAHPTTVERFKMTAGQLKPSGASQTIVTGLPDERQHEEKGKAWRVLYRGAK